MCNVWLSCEQLSVFLTTLFLCGNDLTTLPSEVFSGLASLAWMTLEDCELTTLSTGIFSALSSLRTLELSGNELEALPPRLFAGVSGIHNSP